MFNHEELVQYYEYLKLIKELGEPAKGAQWKLKDEALEKSHFSLAKIQYALNSETLERVKESFKRRKKLWKKNCFEDDEFLVIYPKSIDDLIREGLVLQHCAKEFITHVAEGDTEIYFIRRKDAPDRPFYTLEIMGSWIRQCHGKQNRNIDEVEGLMEFIEAFGRAKNIDIDYETLSEQLAPEEDDDDEYD